MEYYAIYSSRNNFDPNSTLYPFLKLFFLRSRIESMSSFPNNHRTIYEHDVFLNFRGEDTRKNFVSHLYAALANAGVNAFLDEENIDKGLSFPTTLYETIEKSRISIVVFSERYAYSTWCLDELAKIMHCQRTMEHVVLPVFYDVDPSDVRHHRGTFGKALEAHLGRYLGMTSLVSGWKTALTQSANLVGWDMRNRRRDSKVVKEIVTAVLEKLDATYLPITDFPVGIESRVQDVTRFLRKQKGEFCIVGIWGMGGIGKTTIAKAVYNKIRHRFKHKSFLSNIREVWEKDRDQIDLQEQLLSDILKTRKLKVHSIERGKAMIKERFCTKRALIVLDDVNKSEQLNALCGNGKWIGRGSVIIVTTRDVRLLSMLKVNHVYRMNVMDEKESIALFSWHCFGEESPKEGFSELSRKVVACCEGLPLALEVLGSYLYDRTEEEWRSVLSKLEKIPNDQIHEKLRISFDGLKDHMEKNIFLDICCFFIGKDRAYVTQILNGCGLHADIGITVLIERSLIKVEKNSKLGMHCLLRDMGREIVRQSSPIEPEKRSRLWFPEDVIEVLTEHSGTKSIEGLALKLQRSSRVCFSTIAFEKMKRLRLLQLDHVQLTGDYDYLPKQLRWLSWQGSPFKYMPDNFFQGNLVAIDLKRSNLIQVWKNPQMLERLKILNLSHSMYLTNTPDFSKLPNLERLILKDCPNLSKIDESIGNLTKLLLINLMDCTRLSYLPRIIYKLKSLKTLILSGCSKIVKLEEDIMQMESLTTLIAENIAVKQVPISIIRSKSIAYISLRGCEGLARDVFPSLLWSWMSPTMNPKSCAPSFGSMSSSIVFMDLKNGVLGDISPMIRSLSKIRSVWVQCDTESQLSQELERILDDTYHDANFAEMATTSGALSSQMLEQPLRFLLVGLGSYHQVLDALSHCISEGLISNRSGDLSLPSDSFPNWLAHISERSVVFNVPHISDFWIMKGMIMCVVYSSSTAENMADDSLISYFIVNHTKCTIQIYKRDTAMYFNDEDWKGLKSNLEPGDSVEIFAAYLGHGLTIKKTAVYLTYGRSITTHTEAGVNGQMESCLEPNKTSFIKLMKFFLCCKC